MNEPIEVWGNGWARPYDALDRRIARTPQQSQWTPEMWARVVSDQQASDPAKVSKNKD